MQNTAVIDDIGIDLKTGKAKITFLFDDKYILQEAEELKDKKLNVEATRWYKKRSLNANAYLWVLIGKLAEKLNISNIEVYKKHIKEAGKYTVLQMEEEVMTEFERIWQKNGLGWFCEKAIDEYGQVVLLAYNGSSSYNTKQMTRLIDSVIQDCKEQQIETMTPEELKSLLARWERWAKEVKRVRYLKKSKKRYEIEIIVVALFVENMWTRVMQMLIL